MSDGTPRMLLASVALLAFAIGLGPAVEPAARAVDPSPAVESPSPDPGASPSADPSPAVESPAPDPGAEASPVPSAPPDPSPAPVPSAAVDPSPAPAAVPSAAPAASATPTPTPTPTPSPGIGSPSSPMSRHLSGDVYGYLPYWEMSSAVLDYLDYDALSVISLFSVTWTGSGTLARTESGYKAIVGTIGRSVVAAAKSRGVRVELCFTTFGYTKNENLFGSPARQATAIAELRALVRDLGLQGVNVDAELIKGVWFDEYATFLANLRAALRADNPTATVSVATNANTSGAQMAKRAADAGADRIFIMGYAYRSAGSNPGAIAPLTGRSSPSGLDIRWTIDRYAAEGVPLGRVLLGLPYYGMTWPTASSALGAARTGSGTTYTPRKQIGKPASLGVSLRYEPGESVSWYAWYDKVAKTWRQVFYDTPTSLRPKYAYAISRHLAGVGIWALGYDRGVPGYWSLLKTMFGPPRVASLALAPNPTSSLVLSATVTATPGSRKVTHARFGQDGHTWGAWQPLPAAGTTAPDGSLPPALAVVLRSTTGDRSQRVYVQVRDEGGTVSAAGSATVVVDRTGPVLGSAPEVWYSATSRSWRARWRATDAHGPILYKVWYTVNGGAWRTLVTRTSASGMALPLPSRSTRVVVRVKAIDALGNWGAYRVGRP
jgi:spore germination protein YaaH